jgi:hypothetical protein
MKLTLPVVPICRRREVLLKIGIDDIFPRIPCPQRGALRDRHECWARDAMDAKARATSAAEADGQVVWSWRPWAGAKFAGDDPAGDGDYEVTDTGESTKQPLTPSRRECR